MPSYSELNEKFDSFRQELLQNTAIVDLTRSNQIPSERLLNSAGPASAVEVNDSIQESDVILKDVNIDHHFIDTYGIKLVAGRNFLKNRRTDDTTAFIINEIAAKQIGWKTAEDAIDKKSVIMVEMEE